MEKAAMKEYFFTQGEKMRSAVVANPMLSSVIVALPLLYGTYKMWTDFTKFMPQGSIIPGSRVETKDEKPNPWFRDDYVPNQFEVGRKSVSWNTLPREVVLDKIAKNVIYTAFHVEVNGEPKMYESRSLCVGGNLYVTDSHCIPKENTMRMTVVMGDHASGISTNFSMRIGDGDICRIEGTDLAFFMLENTPPKRDLKNCIPARSFRTICDGVRVMRKRDGSIQNMEVRAMKYRDICYNDPRLPAVIPCWDCKVPAETLLGECGSPYVGFTNQGPHILGLHLFGGNGKLESSAQQLTRESVDYATKYFGVPQIQGCEPYLRDQFDQPVQLGPIHHKSPTRFIEDGNAHVYGSFQGFRPAHSSKVCDTLIRTEMEEQGYVTKTDKPVMSGWKPWYAATKDIVQQTFDADQSCINACVDAFTADILSGLDKNQLKELVILDDLSTVNGIPGVKFIDKMNRRTSMGWPWNKSKMFFLSEPHEEDIWQDAVDFDDAFYIRVNRIIESYKDGERHMPVFMGHLKDEPTKLAKIEAGLTRVFCGAPADWSFVVRKYMLSFVRVLQNNKYLFEAAPGTNATSTEWEKMYRYLTVFGRDRMVAGDFSKFDKRMSAQWILAAFKVISNVLRVAGWSDEDIQIIRGIGVDTSFPLCNMNGDLIEFWGSNPSGHPLTVIINSLVNALYMRYAWTKSGNDLALFKQQVHLMTYGDDNVMGVSPEAKNFGHTKIQAEMEKIGVKYTMADKESESVPFIDIKDISFLKRAWRYEPEIGSHVAQLEEDSIAKMLTKCIPSKYKCREQQAVDLMTGALQEYFFYGRETFEAKRTMFLGVVEKLDLLAYYDSNFPVYEELKERYFENSKDVVYQF